MTATASHADRLRRLCRAVLGALDGPVPDAAAGELARAVEAGVGAVAASVRRDLAAWDAALAGLRALPAGGLLGPPPGVAAAVAELEEARAAAARLLDALDDAAEPVFAPAAAPPERAPEGGRASAVSAPSGGRQPPEHATAQGADAPRSVLMTDPPPDDLAGPPGEKPTERAARLFLLAQTRHKDRQLARAEDLYTAALRTDPRFGPAYSRRGQVRLARGRAAAAVADFDAAVDLDPTAAEAWWWRGDAHAVAGRFDRAVDDYTRALELCPDLHKARFNLAVALRRGGEPDRALAEFAAVLAACPGHPGAHLNRGLIHRDRGDKEAAAAEFRAALEHDPGFEPARRELTALVVPPRPDRDGKKGAGTLVVNCPRCGHTGEVPWDRLGRVFECNACRGRFGVRAGGVVVELVAGPDGRWVDATALRDAARRRRKRRLLAAGVLAAAVLFPAGGYAGWRAVRPAAGAAAEAELPAGLEARAELFARAWAANDVRLMRRLADPARERAVFPWYTRHRPAPALRGPADAVTVQVTVVPGKPGHATARVRVANPASPDHPPADLTLPWEERGGTWHFVPPAK